MTVAELGAATQRTVAERLGISEPSARRMTGILVELGLLDSPIDPAGGNRRRLTLTAGGEQTVHECRELLESRFADLVERSGVTYSAYARNTTLLLKALDAVPEKAVPEKTVPALGRHRSFIDARAHRQVQHSGDRRLVHPFGIAQYQHGAMVWGKSVEYGADVRAELGSSRVGSSVSVSGVQSLVDEEADRTHLRRAVGADRRQPPQGLAAEVVPLIVAELHEFISPPIFLLLYLLKAPAGDTGTQLPLTWAGPRRVPSNRRDPG